MSTSVSNSRKIAVITLVVVGASASVALFSDRGTPPVKQPTYGAGPGIIAIPSEPDGPIDQDVETERQSVEDESGAKPEPIDPPATREEARQAALEQAREHPVDATGAGDCNVQSARQLRRFHEDRVEPGEGIDGVLYKVDPDFEFYLCPLHTNSERRAVAVLPAQTTTVHVNSVWYGDAANVPGIDFE